MGGGVLMMLRSRAPMRLNCNVRGIGVAVNVNVSTEARNVFSLSFTFTPNFWSSSMISRPRSLYGVDAPLRLVNVPNAALVHEVLVDQVEVSQILAHRDGQAIPPMPPLPPPPPVA